MSLDEELRKKLRDLAERDEQERSVLSAAAMDRITARLVRENAALARRRKLTTIAGASAAALAVAAGALFFVRSHDRAPERELADSSAVKAPACARDRSSPIRSTPLHRETRADLDHRARFVTHGESLAAYSADSSCKADVALVVGTVDVWARELRGGELVVHAGDVDVVVHGTVFRVSRLDEAVTVDVDEGRVEVRAPGTAPAFVTTGQSLRVTTGADGAREIVRTSLALDARTSLHAVTGDPLARLAEVAPAQVAEPAAALRTAEARTPSSSRQGATSTAITGSRTPPSTPDSAEAATATAELPSAAAEAAPAASEARPIADVLRDAERAYREGRVDDARALFHAAGSMHAADAEAAWLRLGRLELRAGHADQAVRALVEHRRRFPNGRLAAEALYLEASSERSLGHEDAARALEARLLRDHPASPQAARLR